jgi:hypothetical protein
MVLPKVTVASQDRKRALAERARAERDLSCGREDEPVKCMALATANVAPWPRTDTSCAGRVRAATAEAAMMARAAVLKVMICATGGRCAVADEDVVWMMIVL